MRPMVKLWDKLSERVQNTLMTAFVMGIIAYAIWRGAT